MRNSYNGSNINNIDQFKNDIRGNNQALIDIIDN